MTTPDKNRVSSEKPSEHSEHFREMLRNVLTRVSPAKKKGGCNG